MANWYGTARTNYVTLTDAEQVNRIISAFGTTMHQESESCTRTDGKYAFFPNRDSDGDFDYYMFDDDGDEIEFVWEDIMPFVAEGEVLVVIVSGAEKSRYITGDAQAYCRKGDDIMSTGVALTDIYAKAALSFDVPLGSMTVAEY